MSLIDPWLAPSDATVAMHEARWRFQRYQEEIMARAYGEGLRGVWGQWILGLSEEVADVVSRHPWVEDILRGSHASASVEYVDRQAPAVSGSPAPVSDGPAEGASGR